MSNIIEADLTQAKKYIEENPECHKGFLAAAKACEKLLDRKSAAAYYTLMQGKKGVTTADMHEFYNLNINILRQWLINKGATLDNVKLEYYDVDYRGMCVSRSIKKDNNVMEIPASCIISLEESKTRGYNLRLLDLGIKYNSPHTVLAIELLEIKHDPENEFNYYINCIPKYFDNVPINWDNKKLQNLKGSFAGVKVVQKIFFLLEEYENIKKVFPEFPYSFEDFKWARTAVITRTYAVEREINGVSVKDSIMAPFADMANHSIPPNTHWFFDKTTDKFVVNAKSTISSGEVLYESYGQKCNYRFFINYGFTVAKNPDEEVAICLNPLIHNILSQNIYKNSPEALNFINTSQEIFQIGYNMHSETFKAMMDTAKAKCDAILQQHGKKTTPFDIHNFIVAFMQRTLSEFDTTLQEDLDMLKKYDLGFDMRNCVIQRIGEKKLLHYYITYFTEINCLLLIKDAKEQKRALKKLDKKLAKYKSGHII
jgi:histone-lysine N-methyltransferase SETD3